MNLCLTYMYRDAGNFKSHARLILHNPRGLPAEEVEGRITPLLDQGEYFIAEQTESLPSVAFYATGKGGVTDQDHCWHELTGVFPTPEPPNEPFTIDKIIADLEQAANEGWREFRPGDLYPTADDEDGDL